MSRAGKDLGPLQAQRAGDRINDLVERVRAAQQLASDLRAQGWAEVTVDPYAWNERAIRGWEKAGFVEVSRGNPPDDDHSAEWVLMRFSG